MEIQYLSTELLRPYKGNARTHSKKQIKQIAESIRKFGFNNPILISDDYEIIAGHGRLEAAKLLGMAEVPTLRLPHLSEAERRAYLLADNKIALNASWTPELLAKEFEALIDFKVDLSSTGFSMAEVDLTLDAARNSAPNQTESEDRYVLVTGTPVTRPGDVWLLGPHKVTCGDSREIGSYLRLMGDEKADSMFTDPPYNVRIHRNVSGRGRIRHREFAMASGEMSELDFISFLIEFFVCATAMCRDGAIAFVCMDWRHIRELQTAAENIFSMLRNLCVWNKTNAGMGTFYRSKHELIFVYQCGQGQPVNNFGLGGTGRYRTNVWDYPGVNSMGRSGRTDQALHPTVKPVALVADAIKDCTNRGDIVLDPFGGSGTTLIAAETCGRRARLIELDPLYCDTIVRRYEEYTGKSALLEATGQTFEEVRRERICGSQIQ